MPAARKTDSGAAAERKKQPAKAEAKRSTSGASKSAETPAQKSASPAPAEAKRTPGGQAPSSASPAIKPQLSPAVTRRQDRNSASPSPQKSPQAARGPSHSPAKLQNINSEILKHGNHIQQNVLPTHVEPIVKHDVVVKSPISPQMHASALCEDSAASKRKSPGEVAGAGKKLKVDETGTTRSISPQQQQTSIGKAAVASSSSAAMSLSACSPAKGSAQPPQGLSPQQKLLSVPQTGQGSISPKPAGSPRAAQPGSPSIAHGSPQPHGAAQQKTIPGTPGKGIMQAAGGQKAPAETISGRSSSPSVGGHRDTRPQK